MKFLCSNCKAKYQIPDEKIAGRTLKMDCRRCNTPITIRGDQPQPEELDAAPEGDPQPRAAAPASASARGRPGTSSVGRPAGGSSGGSSVGAHPAGSSLAGRSSAGRSALGADFRRNVGAAGGLAHAAEAPRVTPLDQWHVAINDVPVGPMKRDEIARKIAAGAANADSLAWREGFDDWRPIREIPELAALLRRATHDSDRPPAGRPGAPRPPAPRAPAPRPGAMPAPGARSPLGAPAAARVSARNNVVPIGGRHGASVAPSYEPDDGDDELSGSDGEATTVASAADLGLGDFGKPVRDDGDIPSPHAREAKKDDKPAAKGQTGGFKPIPPPGARPVAPAPAARTSAPVSKPAAPAPKPAPPVAARVEPLDDPFGLPPAEPEQKRGSFAPPPPSMDAAPLAPLGAKPVSVVTPPRDARRGPALGVGAMMGIGLATGAGAVLMYGLVQHFILSPPPPTTTVVATVATIVPPVTEAQHDAVLDDVPPPTTTVAAPPTSDVTPPPTSAIATGTTPHHAGTTPVATTTAPRPPTPRAPAGDDPFAAFADDGAGPAPIATSTTARHDDTTAAHHSSAELTAEQISAVRRGGQRALTQCWEGALRTAGHVDGDVRYDIDITIGTSGTVTVVHARGPTVGTLQDCLERAVRRWVFPASASVTQTTFPIVFSAQQ